MGVVALPQYWGTEVDSRVALATSAKTKNADGLDGHVFARGEPAHDPQLGDDGTTRAGSGSQRASVFVAPPVARKLDPYKPIIDARLAAFPKLSAKRLFDEIHAAG